jgi:hypothetical protein
MLWVDGSLYSSALPEKLRTLEPPEPGMTAGEKARRREAFDAREPYRFVAHGKRNKKRGTQRFRGPAVDGHPFKVRCPNTPASMRMPHTIPTTTCVAGEAVRVRQDRSPSPTASSNGTGSTIRGSPPAGRSRSIVAA